MRNFKTFEEFSFKKDEDYVEHGWDFDYIKNFYKTINKEKKANYSRVAWTTIRNQEVRFQKLLEIGVKNGDSILDFGCGLADLYGYSKKIGLDINYTGVDINEDYVSDAKKQYPYTNIYVIKNINDIKETYDWFFASGSLTLGFKYTEILSLLKRAYLKSKKGVAFNMLTNDSIETYKYLNNYYGSIFCNPIYIVKDLKKFVNRVGVVKGYLDIDFTVYMIK
jgi:SAM-dependent methyltransferase